jgi:hypothetical protein
MLADTKDEESLLFIKKLAESQGAQVKRQAEQLCALGAKLDEQTVLIKTLFQILYGNPTSFSARLSCLGEVAIS